MTTLTVTASPAPAALAAPDATVAPAAAKHDRFFYATYYRPRRVTLSIHHVRGGQRLAHHIYDLTPASIERLGNLMIDGRCQPFGGYVSHNHASVGANWVAR